MGTIKTLFVIVALAAACSKPDGSGTADSPSARADSTAPAMADSLAIGPDTGAAVPAVVKELQAHMTAMRAVGPDSMKAMVATHRQLLGNLIATFNKEMRDMNMAPDAAWNATVDSLRTDLRVLPDLSAPELKSRMPAHEGRITRLVGMHRTMMKNMKM
jgi:phosphohistidine phosphatase SixA